MLAFESSSSRVSRADRYRTAVAIALWLGANAGCGRIDANASTVGPREAAVPSGEPASPPARDPDGSAPLRDPAAPGSIEREPLAAYTSALPVGGKSVGHTSVVFKLGLEGGVNVAFKPRSTRGDHRYRGEVAAYRLARALSLENVPLAMTRSFDYGTLRAAVGHEAIFAEVVKEPDDSVRGALMPWIKGLEFLPLENGEWMPKWRGWLKQGAEIPAEQRDLAAQISDLLVFDLVAGNWDRWSGGNIAIDRARGPHGTLLYVDNDGAFFDPPPVKEMKWPTALFEGVERFSRRFVASLRAVDVARAVGDEAPGEPLLSRRVLSQTEARRKHVLAIVDAKIAKLGEPAVLAFD